MPQGVRLALKLLFVGIVCSLSTEIGFANKIPPHNIAALWPTVAILFAVLVVAPVRHWWAYILAAYFTSVINDARAGFPPSAILFVAAGVIEVLIAATGVRLFAGGTRSFDSLRNLIAYVAIAVVLAPLTAAFVAAFAGSAENYWFYWRTWFLGEALAYLTLAPVILTAIGTTPAALRQVSFARFAEACMIICGLLAVSVSVFVGAFSNEGSIPALVYLPLPFVLWAAVRFGPPGVNASLLIVALLAITGAVQDRGPFHMAAPGDNVLSVQLFLFVSSLPLMFLAALIAERRERVSALRESEARFRIMADSAPVLIWMAGEDKQCIFFNRNWLEFTGRTLNQEIGSGWVEGVHLDDLERCWATYAEAFEARREFEMEYRLRRHDGEFRWVLDRGVPRFSQDGAFLGYIGCADDITDRRRAEEEATLQRQEVAHLMRVSVLSELSGAIAHEINQPLAAVQSNAESGLQIISASELDVAELRDVLRDIANDTRRASEVIQRMRNLMKKGERPTEPVDLNDVIQSTLALLHSELINRRVAVGLDLGQSLPAPSGDPIQLQQVVLNLVVNAMDAMQSTPVAQRTIAISTRLAQNEAVEVRVKDRGGGIGPAEQAKLFEPFFTTKAHGIGLGLTICSSIVQAHGGKLNLLNDDAGGAVAIFSLPARAGISAAR